MPEPRATPVDETSVRDADLRAELEAARGSPEFPDILRYLVARQAMRDRGEGAPVATTSPDDPEVRDADLRERLARYIADRRFYSMIREQVVREQQARDAKARHLASLGPLARRREEVRDALDAELTDADRYHLHSVLALCGLPYKKPPEGESDYVREYGRSSLVVQAGFLKDPNSGKMVKQGLPYGPKARLLLLHICTMAVRQNSHEIEVADSMSAFIRELGFDVTGGPRGTITQFKEQLHRLAAARMQIGLWRGNKTTTISTQPIEAFEVWLPSHPDQRVLWNTKLYMDEKFFRTLKEHALPIDIRAVRAFANSAKQIDILLWLVYRLRHVERPLSLSWDNLKQQFGRDVTSRDRKFRQSFADDLKHIQEVYPNLRLQVSEKGVIFHPTDGKALLAPQKRALKRP
ncbi:replication protein RepA [Rhodoplanes sp. SY1]|uniref:replication protein RepA n=1 Tax=Rhodoplanes sp. SY1 TaxID=3166646 RepID=UPI0038B64B76